MRISFAAVLVLASCGPKVLQPDDSHDNGSSGELDASTAGSTGTATTGLVDPGDYGEMLECSLTTVCPAFLHPYGENAPLFDDGFYDEERCILSGLRDGTPGRYVFGAQYISSNCYGELRRLIHVHADRRVTFAVHDESGCVSPPGELHSEEYTPAKTCTLADPAYFIDCLENHDDETVGQCLQVDDWWTGCAEMGPRCE